jgi:hypothetical protein
MYATQQPFSDECVNYGNSSWFRGLMTTTSIARSPVFYRDKALRARVAAHEMGEWNMKLVLAHIADCCERLAVMSESIEGGGIGGGSAGDARTEGPGQGGRAAQ